MPDSDHKDTQRELVDLARSPDLSPEEQKKILAIMTSIKGGAAKHDRGPDDATKIYRITMVIIAVLAVLLLGAAWYLLDRLEKKERMLPRPTVVRESRPAPPGPGQ